MNEQNGLWANIRAKRARGERMRKPGEKGAPTQDALKRSKGEAVAETVDKSSDVYKEYLELKKKPIKELRDMIKRIHRVVDVSGYDKQSAISDILRSRHGNKKVAAAMGLDEMTTTADAGIPQDTKNMGPRLKSTVMHDRRRRKDAIPVLLKRFRKYIEDKNIG
jgi:hypothetical protein